jgi:hypothetical protein
MKHMNLRDWCEERAVKAAQDQAWERAIKAKRDEDRIWYRKSLYLFIWAATIGVIACLHC